MSVNLRRIQILWALLFIVHFGVVSYFSVNLPFGDEWDQTEAWNSNLIWNWLAKPHNEHRIVPTKIEAWVFGQWTGANYRWQQIFNFVIFGVLAGIAIAFFYRISTLPRIWVWAFFLFLLSTANFENHLWAFQSQFHFFLLFGFLAAFSYFSLTPWRAALFGSLFSVAAIYSFSAGVILAGAVTLGYFGFRRKDWAPALFALFFVGIGIVLWKSGNAEATGHLPKVSIISFQFFELFMNLVSFGFGIQRVSWWVGAGCFVFVLLPWGLLVRRFYSLSESERRAVFGLGSLVLGILAILASIAISRATLGVMASKTSRYHEIAYFLIPLSAAGWALRLKVNRDKFLKCFWIFVFCCYADNWGLNGYRWMQANRLEGQKCLRELIEKGGDGICKKIHPGSLTTRLNRARDLNLSFYSELIQ